MTMCFHMDMPRDPITPLVAFSGRYHREKLMEQKEIVTLLELEIVTVELDIVAIEIRIATVELEITSKLSLTLTLKLNLKIKVNCFNFCNLYA